MSRKAIFLVLLSIFREALGQEAQLGVNIKDAITGRPVACTVHLVDANGKSVIENDSFKSGFRCSGSFTRRLPPGRASLRITRGFETMAFTTNLSLSSKQETHLTLHLHRSINLRQRG